MKEGERQKGREAMGGGRQEKGVKDKPTCSLLPQVLPRSACDDCVRNLTRSVSP